SHGAQIAMAARIPAGAVLLEVGCGDTAAATELMQRVPGLSYYGVEITLPGFRNRSLRLARASALQLPIANASYDTVVSMFTIEHSTHPPRFLAESWRVLRTGGELHIVAPDFVHNAMASERIGNAYGTGREKLRKGHFIDAARTFYDSRFRLPSARRARLRRLRRGAFSFPVLVNPRCLGLPGFVTDCDAVYPAAPEEITNYFNFAYPGNESILFYRDANTFGMAIRKIERVAQTAPPMHQ
ncbi:MAG TPA: class I SAM-dependent methyltransferase, partial [Longimicrobiales bacterium]|nr:class I SAM-dependent methyltransferase [Longimicrobiales bacterium]